MAPTSHSNVGASSCERWWNCPKSCSLIAKLTPAGTSKYAAEGTAAHALCEHVLKNKVHYNSQWWADSMIGETIETEDGEFKVTEEMAEAADMYVKTILSDVQRIGATLKGNLEVEGKDSWKNFDKDTQNRVYSNWVNIEQSFELKDIDSEARGTNDASIYRPGEVLIVYDFKYGAGIPVEATENKQMLYYAIGAAGNDLMNFKTIELVIIQPRAEHPQGPIRRWVTTPEYVAKFKEELRERIAETRNPDAKTCAGKWCRFCNAKMICPAMREKSYELAKVDFSKPTKENTIKAPSELTNEELKIFLDNADLLENYISAVREYALKVLDGGGSIEGYKLVRSSKTHRKWNDTEENIATMLELELGIDRETLFTSKIKTPAQVEKLVKGSKDVVAAYCYRPEGELKLARVEDIREKQIPSAISDFSELGL